MKKNFKQLIPAVVFFALLALGQLQRIQLTASIAIYIHDLFIISWLVAYYLRYKLDFQQIINKFKQLKLINKLLIFWLVITFILNNLINPANLIINCLYLSRWLVYLLFVKKFTEINSRSSLAYLLLWSNYLIIIWGLIQYLFLPDLRFLKVLGWDDHFHRLASTQLDPNFTGLIIILSYWLQQIIIKKFRLNKSLSLLSDLVISLSLVFTYSRSSLFSFILSLVFSLIFLNKAIKNKTKNWLRILILSLILTLLNQYYLKTNPMIGGEGINLARTSSATARLDNLRFYLDQLNTGEWLIGKNLTNLNKTKTIFTNHAHFAPNILVFIIYASGLIGLSLSLLTLNSFLKKLIKKQNYFLPILIAALSHSLFNHSLLQAFVFIQINFLYYLSQTKNEN